MSMRFGQGLISSLINPDYGRNLFSVGQAAGQLAAGVPQQVREEQERKRGMFTKSIDLQQQFQRAQQGGDARLARESANSMLDMARKSGDADLAQKALAQLEQVKGINQQGALKGVINIDRALANPSISPEAKSSLESRKAELLKDPSVYEAYSAAQTAQAEAARDEAIGNANLVLKEAQVEEVEREQKVGQAVKAIRSGATAESLKGGFGADIVADAEAEVRDWKVANAEAKAILNESDGDSIDYNSSAFKNLLPEQQQQIKDVASTSGVKKARQLFSKKIMENADAKVEAKRNAAEQQQEADVSVAVARYLSGDVVREDRGEILGVGLGTRSTPVVKMYKDADEDMKEAIRTRAESLMVQALNEARSAAMPPQEATQAAIEAVDRALTREFTPEEKTEEATDKVKQGVVEVSSRKEAEQLPSGTRFKGPDGIERIKP